MKGKKLTIKNAGDFLEATPSRLTKYSVLELVVNDEFFDVVISFKGKIIVSGHLSLKSIVCDEVIITGGLWIEKIKAKKITVKKTASLSVKELEVDEIKIDNSSFLRIDKMKVKKIKLNSSDFIFGDIRSFEV